MAPVQPGLTPLRRGVVAALVVVLLLVAVLYYRASTSTPGSASSSGTGSSIGPSEVVGTGPLASPTPTPTSGTTPAEVGPIKVYGNRVRLAEPSETVQVRGTYHGAPEAFLQLQIRDGTTWKVYPYSPKTDWMGRFIAHVEIAESGPHWVRVVDPGADLASEPFVVMIED